MLEFLRNAIENRFDTSSLQEALEEAIEDLIDYDEIASTILHRYEDEIDDMIADVAESLL